MPVLTDNDQDTKSSIDEGYEKGHGAYESAGLDQLEAYANDPKNHDDVGTQEEGSSDEGWKTNVGHGKNIGEKAVGALTKNKVKAIFRLTKKKGAIAGLLAVFGIGGGLLASFFGPVSMLVGLTENFSLTNDSASTAMERRFMKAFGFATQENPDPVCANASKSIKCRMGRISNKAMYQLQQRGVTPIIDGERYDGTTKKGYPKVNPSHYEFDLGEGKKAVVGVVDLPGFLAQKENRQIATKILGRSGAFNLRVKAWSGKYISKFYGKFGLSRNGGLADGKNKKLSASEKLKAAQDKLKEKIPGMEKLSSATESLRTKVQGHLGKAKKGGVGYMMAVASCVAIKAPSYTATTVAGVQLLQVMPFFLNIVGSPGSKQKASGVDTKNSVTAEDIDGTASLITNRTPRESDGKMTSALDSQILLAALGVNKGKPAVSSKYAPGYSFMQSDIVKASRVASQTTEPACNAIMSPTAMYTAMVVDAGVTVAASTTLIGGLIKVGASFAVSEITSALVGQLVSSVAQGVITDLAKNDAIPKAQGEALGDVIGISASAFFSAAAMHRHLPTLKQSQLVAAEQVRQENEAFNREMDIASLSPFDTSSQYTFLGSIVHNTRTAMITSGSFGVTSLMGSLFKTPAMLLSPSTSAANFTNEYCSYASDFNMTTENPADTPAVNQAGLPCTGLLPEQAAMNTDEAIQIMLDRQWIDESKTINDGDTIEELRKSGYIKPGTPLDDFITSCSNAETGDYLINSAGCTINEPGSTAGYSSDGCVAADTCISETDAQGAGTAESVPSVRDFMAMSVFLLDFQTIQSMNGEDEGTAAPSGSGGGGPADGTVVSPVAEGFSFSDPFGPRSCSGCSTWHNGIDLLNSGNPEVRSMMAGTVVSADKSGGNNVVRIKHAGGLISVYFHMYAQDILVNTGDTVTAGQPIGKIGNSGQSFGAHLHFEIDITEVEDPNSVAGYRKNEGGYNPVGSRIDPREFLKNNGVPGY